MNEKLLKKHEWFNGYNGAYINIPKMFLMTDIQVV